MRNIRLAGSLFKIRLSLHNTWYLAFILITAVIVTRYPEYYAFSHRVLMGVGTALLFFLAMLVRQLLINAVCTYRRIPIKGVILYPFGGVPLIAREESLPILETLMAVVGLLASLIIVALFYLAYVVLVISDKELVSWLVQWLAYVNLILFLINFIPAFPLEGGTILRAFLWKITRNYDRAALITIRLGQLVAAAFFIGGVVLLVNQQWFVGAMVTGLGWALFLAAARGVQTVAHTWSLGGMTAYQIMSREFSEVPADLTLDDLVRDYVLAKGHSHFVVCDGDRLQGILNIEEIRSVPRKKWESTPVSRVMTPSSPLTTAYIDQSASDLLDRMNVHRLNFIPVLDGQQVAGLVIRDAVVRFNKSRARLKI